MLDNRSDLQIEAKNNESSANPDKLNARNPILSFIGRNKAMIFAVLLAIAASASCKLGCNCKGKELVSCTLKDCAACDSSSQNTENPNTP